MSDEQPDRNGWHRPPGGAIELENRGYIGNDPPPGKDGWPNGTRG